MLETNCRYINRNFKMLIKVMLCLCETYEYTITLWFPCLDGRIVLCFQCCVVLWIGMVENAGTGYRIRIPDTGYGYRIRIRIRIPDTGYRITDTGYGYRIRIPDTDTDTGYGYGYRKRIPDSLKYLFLRIKIVGYCIFGRFFSHF